MDDLRLAASYVTLNYYSTNNFSHVFVSESVCEHMCLPSLWCIGGGQRKLGVLVSAVCLVLDGLLAAGICQAGDLETSGP